MAGNIGGRERAVGKRLGMEEAEKGQLERGWNRGGREKSVGKGVGMERQGSDS